MSNLILLKQNAYIYVPNQQNKDMQTTNFNTILTISSNMLQSVKSALQNMQIEIHGNTQTFAVRRTKRVFEYLKSRPIKEHELIRAMKNIKKDVNNMTWQQLSKEIAAEIFLQKLDGYLSIADEKAIAYTKSVSFSIVRK